MRPDGSEQRQLTYSRADNTDPVWSPEGTLIAFNSQRDGNSEIYMMRPDGSHQTRLTQTPDMFEERPAWSPDGRYLLFSQSGSEWRGLAKLELSSGRVEPLTNPDSFFMRPNVSPSGEWVIAERR